MANRRPPTNALFNEAPRGGEGEERVMRRSEIVALERRRSSTGSARPVIVQEKPKRKRRPPKIPWKKPKGMPKRPLSAYNFFFRHEREEMLRQSGPEGALSNALRMDVDMPHARAPSPARSLSASLPSRDDRESGSDSPRRPRPHTKTSGIGFANLANTVANKWKTLDADTRAVFEAKAAIEKEKYLKEMAVWRAKQQQEKLDCEDSEQKEKGKSTLQRRQSSPPEHHPPLPDNVGSVARRASAPSAMLRTAPSFDRALSPHESESSSWAEPFDGGSLGSMDDQDWENTLEWDESRERSAPRRTLSDSMLQIRYDVRPCEELAADVEVARRFPVVEEAKEATTISSLQALEASLDDDMVDFITALNK